MEDSYVSNTRIFTMWLPIVKSARFGHILLFLRRGHLPIENVGSPGVFGAERVAAARD